MIFNLTGGGVAGAGSGTGLNFRVVGGTSAPSNPVENTIWVNTSTTIISWMFSSTKPSEPTAGMVWIVTSASSNVELNALKKNGIMLYPINAKQYIGSAWVSMAVKIYQGSKWVDLTTYLYDNGDECTTYSGGWTAYAYKRSNVDGQGTAKETAPTLTKNTSTMEVSFKQVSVGSSTSGAYYYPGSVFAEKAIDLTGVSTITIKMNGLTKTDSDYGSSEYYLEVTKGKANNYTVAASVELTSQGTFTVDVSSLTGTYYVAIGVGTCRGAGVLEIAEIKYQ